MIYVCDARQLFELVFLFRKLSGRFGKFHICICLAKVGMHRDCRVNMWWHYQRLSLSQCITLFHPGCFVKFVLKFILVLACNALLQTLFQVCIRSKVFFLISTPVSVYCFRFACLPALRTVSWCLFMQSIQGWNLVYKTHLHASFNPLQNRTFVLFCTSCCRIPYRPCNSWISMKF